MLIFDPPAMAARFGLGVRYDELPPRTAEDFQTVVTAELAGQSGMRLADRNLPSSAAALSYLDPYMPHAKRVAAREARAAIAETGSARDIPDLLSRPAWILFQSEAIARFEVATETGFGFVERLVWFWMNHFAVARRNATTMAGVGAFEREAIRAHVGGRFVDMLVAVETHPVMLSYLDAHVSVGPNSVTGKRRERGLNENLARETLELHTVGVEAGYDQRDVEELARAFTGWTVTRTEDEFGELGAFAFAVSRHEPGERIVLGRRYPEGGLSQGLAILKDLARHPSTAERLSEKLARHFVSEVPPRALVERLVDVWRNTDGNLTLVAETLAKSREAIEMPPNRLRTPLEYLVAAHRALKLAPDLTVCLRALHSMGHEFWSPPSPEGFDESETAMLHPVAARARLNVAGWLAARALAIGWHPGVEPAEFGARVLGARFGPEISAAVTHAESRQQALALIIAAPGFQRR